MATECICVFKDGERFAHGHCFAFHEQVAVGYVTDPQTLTVQRGTWYGDQAQQLAAQAEARMRMLTQCPKCRDTAIVQRERAPAVFVWVADGWRDDDGLEVEIDYCPSCGIELLDSDEYGELPPERPVLCMCGHGPHAHANDETACNGIECCCRSFKLDVESVRPQ